jgi:GT2 family glycosyltransferase
MEPDGRMTSSKPPAITAVVVNWNGRRFLPGCLQSLFASSLPVEVLIVDNASDDGSVEYLRGEHPELPLLALPENAGYAGGANAGIRQARADYVMVMNPDVILAPDHLRILVEKLQAEPAIGAAQGKLLQIRPDDYLASRLEAATRIDSAGHAIRRTRMVVDIGQGQADDARFDQERSVFSACGAAVLLRREMLEDVAPDGEYFDESFFAYKEDIDLCWRARLRGWDVRYVPAALGYHVRGWAGTRPPPPTSLPLAARRHSWKNHYLLILKNDRALDALLALPFLLGWELLRQGHAILRDRKVYGAYRDLRRILPAAWRRRREMAARRRASPREMRRWFGAADGLDPPAASGTPVRSLDEGSARP